MESSSVMLSQISGSDTLSSVTTKISPFESLPQSQSRKCQKPPPRTPWRERVSVALCRGAGWKPAPQSKSYCAGT
jgi:hypothetical protein